MKVSLLIWMTFFILNNTMQLDFGASKSGENWLIINDGVMGGLSKGNIAYTSNSIKFLGSVSLANNGGFTSFKSPFGIYNLSDAKKIKIRYRSTGQGIAVTLETHRRFYRPYFKVYLAPTNSEWVSVELDIDQFMKYTLGRPTGGSITTKDLTLVQRVGFMTADKKEGPFEFEVDYLSIE